MSILRFSAPTIQGLPIPLATTAAWLVMPPFVVNIPTDVNIPLMSSGLVSSLTKMTFFPLAASISALSGSKTISPTAAPGEAFKPFSNNFLLAESTNCGCRTEVI